MKRKLPKEILSLNVTQRMHWATRSRHRKSWQGIVALAFGKRKKTQEKRKVTITSYRKRDYDHDNFVGGCKPVIDALVKVGWLWDDAPKWVDVEYIQARVAKGEEAYTEVEVV